MDAKKKLKIVEEIEEAKNAWVTETRKKNHYNLDDVALAASVNIILSAGRKDPITVICPFDHCSQLDKSCSGGDMKIVNNSYCWSNYATYDAVYTILERFPGEKLLHFTLNNVEEIRELRTNLVSHYETILPFILENECQIVTTPSLCRLLGMQFKGSTIEPSKGHFSIWKANEKYNEVLDFICQIRGLKRTSTSLINLKIEAYCDKLHKGLPAGASKKSINRKLSLV